jgi:Fic-DOC domain mobile mystery protein B
VALIGELVPGETPLSEQDVQGLKLPLVKTRAQLNAVEGANILGGKQWALGSRNSRIPKMITVEYMQELHRRMLGDVWRWAGEIRTIQLQNEFAASVPDIRPHLGDLYKDAVDYWLNDKRMSPDQIAVRLHHRVVKIHPFRNGNGRHSRLLADLLLDKHFRAAPFTWGGNAGLGNTDPNRQAYLHGLRAADKGDYAPLLRLCRAL